MSVSIKVAIRCRPFTIDDKLGVTLAQNTEEEGEVTLINTAKYSTTRFPFTYAWWSAYGWQRHATGDCPEAEGMTLVNQENVYDSCGTKIKTDLMQGNAVVLFAYGLSGSGKTFTVFGPDAPDSPDAWFKHATPHSLWGIFPRLAYEIFQMKQDGWKVSMKYFQNVVDTVRDLMSPVAQEQHYKQGMRKDGDGFMDIEWCQSKVLHSWDDLRATFMKANERKAIAPTQFNHQSTRGHCIMTLEVEMPHPEQEGMKQRGRVYVCDLAGTEPAGDIVFAKYQKVEFEGGDVEYKYIGEHDDPRKTKELRDQGKKINLSLSEMAQFFMKMAEAVKAKKLKPGMSIPGCNSFFLCKYLKDTMLQARTYLFCAIRPEVTYHQYTFSTLGFARNASVVKLQPKKATMAATAAERRLMAELEQMKALVAQLTEQNSQLKGSGGEAGNDQILRLQEMLATKQQELEKVLTDGGAESDGAGMNQDQMLLQQREEYGRRGIALAYFDKDTPYAHFINLDEDPFRSKRFLYILDKPRIVFGPHGDIQPLTFSVVRDHCVVEHDEDEGTIVLIGGKGETYRNGARVTEGQRVTLQPFDRVAIGGELLLFHNPATTGEEVEPLSAEEAVQEYQNALNAKGGEQQQVLLEQMRQLQEEKEKWEKEKASSAAESEQAEVMYKQAMLSVDREIMDLLPKVKEAKRLVDLMNRSELTFEASLYKTKDDSGLGVPKVKIKVHNSKTSETILVDPFEFLRGLSILKDEMMKLRQAVENDREYTISERNDPLYLLFDITFHLGTVTIFPMYLAYNMGPEDDEIRQQITNAAVPYNNIGMLEVRWTPLPAEGETEILEVEDPSELIGKSWTYKLEIVQATGLPVIADMTYCQYDFFGQTYTTDTVEIETSSPQLNYEYTHHIDMVTQEFLDFLDKPLEIQLYISPAVAAPKDQISTSNDIVKLNITTGKPHRSAQSPNSGNGAEQSPEITIATLQQRVQELEEENQALKARIVELEGSAPPTSNGTTDGSAPEDQDRPISRQRIESAITIDKQLNDTEAPAN